MSRLREVSTEEFAPQQAQEQPNHAQASAVSLKLLVLALKTLSERTIVALAALKAMILAGTVFWLALTIMVEPTSAKLTGLAIYASFILLIVGMDLRRHK